eukprot:EC818651.1.p1 GENE.EC818651.1~~EC818651.1.p1  ORF type:complete len:70 (+),score=14.87 EC818651.1:50-259(+)
MVQFHIFVMLMKTLYSKSLTAGEYTALSIPNAPSYKAVVVQVQKNECVCISDYLSHKGKIYFRSTIIYF